LEQYFLNGKIRLSSADKSALLDAQNVNENDFFVMTSHRRENVENPASLQRIMDLAAMAVSPVIFPASYRTQRNLKNFGTVIPRNVRVVDPIGYVELLELIVSSTAVLTDSGTVVEETAVLGVPSVQMRRSTERPQVYDCGSSVKFDPHSDWSSSELAGVINSARNRRDKGWSHGLGDGQSSMSIADDLIMRMQNPESLFGHSTERADRPFQRNLGLGIGNLGDWH
ncbi:MAG: UDP-N-acetylglucosamine 2-epimerase, partial [Actinomycetota bacterium]